MTPPARRGRVAVSGARGFVGRRLVDSLLADGIEVIRLVRGDAGPGEVAWDPQRGTIDAPALAGADAVVHLAGESILGRWTAGRKRRILESRANGTRLLAEAIAGLATPPPVLISASAVGYYGDRGEALLREDSPPGDDFLARVCIAWEGATQPAAEAGVRVVNLRFGLVLDPSGGALGLMLLPFKLGVGGRLGSGRQWMSWISLRDAVRAIRFVMEADGLAGPLNAVAPEPVRNAEFTRSLAALLGRPALIPAPRSLLHLVFGEMADAALLASQRAIPERLDRSGFTFRDPSLDRLWNEGLDGNG